MSLLAPAVLQYGMEMEKCFQDHRGEFIIPYFDDLLVYSSSHVEYLQLTFQRLRQCGVKIKARKCQLRV